MNSSRLKAVLCAVEEGARGPPQLSIHDAVRAEFEGYLVPGVGGGWALTPKALSLLGEAVRGDPARALDLCM